MNRLLMRERSIKIEIIWDTTPTTNNFMEEGYMDIVTINKLLDEINEDRSVPKNIRNSLIEVKHHLNSDSDMAIKVNSAVSILDEISNDPNIPVYARTQIWNIVSMLEILDKR